VVKTVDELFAWERDQTIMYPVTAKNHGVRLMAIISFKTLTSICTQHDYTRNGNEQASVVKYITSPNLLPYH
jgi:hypothetical protein